MKPVTKRNIALLLILALSAYFAYNIITRGIQSISLYDWYLFLIDISLGLIVIGAALTKMRQ